MRKKLGEGATAKPTQLLLHFAAAEGAPKNESLCEFEANLVCTQKVLDHSFTY